MSVLPDQPTYFLYVGAALTVTATLVAAWRNWIDAAIVPLLLYAFPLMGATAQILPPLALQLTIVATAVAVGAIGLWRQWPALTSVAEATPYLVLLLHATQVQDARSLLVITPLLMAAQVALAWGHRSRSKADAAWLLGLGLPAFIGGWALLLIALETQRLDAYRGPLTLGLGLVALALAWIARSPATPRFSWAGAGYFLLLLWPPIHFHDAAIPTAWLGLFIASVVARHVIRADWARWVAVIPAAFTVAYAFFVLGDDILEDRLAIHLSLALFAGITLSLLAAWHLERRRTKPDALQPAMLAGTLATPVVYTALTLEGYVISIAWAAEGVLALVAGFAFSIRDLRLGALGLFALVLGRLFLIDLPSLPLAVRLVTFLAVGLLLLVASFLYARRRTPRSPTAQPQS